MIDGDSVVERGRDRGLGDVLGLPRTIVVLVEFISSLSLFHIRGRGNSSGNPSCGHRMDTDVLCALRGGQCRVVS